MAARLPFQRLASRTWRSTGRLGDPNFTQASGYCSKTHVTGAELENKLHELRRELKDMKYQGAELEKKLHELRVELKDLKYQYVVDFLKVHNETVVLEKGFEVHVHQTQAAHSKTRFKLAMQQLSAVGVLLGCLKLFGDYFKIEWKPSIGTDKTE